MPQSIDLLVLAVSRVKKGVALAGMSTEPDPVTGRKWVQLARADGALQLSDITLADGALIRPGDVVRCVDLEPAPEPPFTEQWRFDPARPLTLLRHITPERYARFFPEHLDRDPAAVLERRERSLCLIKASEAHALFEQEPKRFKSYMLLDIPDLGSFDDIPVTDIAWRALGRRWLAEAGGDEMGLDPEDIQARLGDLYLVLGLHRTLTPLVLGIHSIPPYAATLDPAHL